MSAKRPPWGDKRKWSDRESGVFRGFVHNVPGSWESPVGGLFGGQESFERVYEAKESEKENLDWSQQRREIWKMGKRKRDISPYRKRRKTGGGYVAYSGPPKPFASGSRAYAASVAKANVRVSGMLGRGLKFHDASKAETAIVTTSHLAMMDPVAGCLNGIGIGDSMEQREGMKYILKSVYIRGTLIQDVIDDSATCFDPGIVRLVVFIDKQTNGAQCASTICFDDDLVATDETLVLRRIEYTHRCKVLYDKVHVLRRPFAMRDDVAGPPCTAALAGVVKPFIIYKKMNLPVQCISGGGSTVADIVDNSVHVAVVSREAGCKIAYQSRVRFIG